ncbi:Telomere length and silencing protein 1-like protein [Bienertia sinuspersici]
MATTRGRCSRIWNNQHAAPSRTTWSVPAAENVKINVDVAVFNGGGVGLGAVFRSETGSVLAVVVQRRMAWWKADMAEALATRFGLSIARRLGYTRIELESDALSTVKAIHLGSFSRSLKDLMLEDAYVTSLLFDYFSCNHIKRVGNVVAHFAARLSPSNGEECLYIDSIPQGILALAELDIP